MKKEHIDKKRMAKIIRQAEKNAEKAKAQLMNEKGMTESQRRTKITI